MGKAIKALNNIFQESLEAGFGDENHFENLTWVSREASLDRNVDVSISSNKLFLKHKYLDYIYYIHINKFFKEKYQFILEIHSSKPYLLSSLSMK